MKRRSDKLMGMRPAAVRAIDELKPYKGGNDQLWRIHELDIIDKHHALFTVGHDCLFVADWMTVSVWPYLLKARSPDFAGVFDDEVEQAVGLEIDEAVGNSKAGGLLPSLHRLVSFVDSLAFDFKAYLEPQP